MEQQKPKLCIDCVHFIGVADNSHNNSICAHPSLVSVVTGEALMLCMVARSVGLYCDRSAKLFSPRSESEKDLKS